MKSKSAGWLSVWRRLAVVAVPGIAALLGSCKLGAGFSPTADAKVDACRFGSGDMVRVSTFGEQAVTWEFRVSNRGTLAVPLLGPVLAHGLRLTALSNEIGRALIAKRLFRDPTVATEVVSYRPVYIFCEVARPGKYLYEPGMTILTAVAVAGGFTYRVIQDFTSVIRVVSKSAHDSQAEGQTLIWPGDVVTTSECT